MRCEPAFVHPPGGISCLRGQYARHWAHLAARTGKNKLPVDGGIDEAAMKRLLEAAHQGAQHYLTLALDGLRTEMLMGGSGATSSILVRSTPESTQRTAPPPPVPFLTAMRQPLTDHPPPTQPAAAAAPEPSPPLSPQVRPGGSSVQSHTGSPRGGGLARSLRPASASVRFVSEESGRTVATPSRIASPAAETAPVAPMRLTLPDRDWRKRVWAPPSPPAPRPVWTPGGFGSTSAALESQHRRAPQLAPRADGAGAPKLARSSADGGAAERAVERSIAATAVIQRGPLAPRGSLQRERPASAPNTHRQHPPAGGASPRLLRPMSARS
ncbi:hypothetical protein OAO87_01495 [bacterium]|nr:hypothetical protein [bacterium]